MEIILLSLVSVHRMLGLKSAVLFLSFFGGAVSTAEPGSGCSKPFTDLNSCNSSHTLMGCLYAGSNLSCACLTGIYDAPWNGYKYTFEMEWNGERGKCVSKGGSVCNRVAGAENEVSFQGISLTAGSLDCKDSLHCLPDSNYPEEHGICGSAAVGGFKVLILTATLLLTLTSYSFI
jgi:hypothetical protein